jgi:hypothetical protein
MMFEFIKKFFARNDFISIGKFHEVIEYSKINSCGGWTPQNAETSKLGYNLGLQSKPEAWTIRVDDAKFRIGDQIVIPPHIKWGNSPYFRYVAVIDDALELRSGDDGQSAWFLADVTANDQTTREIDCLFRAWYNFMKSHALTTGNFQWPQP